MHFIYYINRLTATKVDLTYLGCLTSNAQRMSVSGFERMTTGSAVSALSYHATQVDKTTHAFCLETMKDDVVFLIDEEEQFD